MVGLIDRNTDKDVFYHDKCDKYDYLTAVCCGAVAGLVDIIFVGSPEDSKLLKWTDKQVDNCVMKFAKLTGWKPRSGQENNVKSAIGFLEKKFPVNYDQRHSGDVDNAFNMSAKNHHMKSLAHSPDIIGLFFSIVNQFTSTSSFISDGKLITIDTETQELKGGNLIAKLFCGTANWFGHLMSDVAGASGAKGRGSGIAMPFFELFGLCNFGKLSVGKDKQDLATIATRAFQEGYDFRFGLTQAIPVVLCDLLIRLIWSLRHYFQYHKPIKECIPTSKHDDLRVMLIVGNGVLCIMDAADAAIRSGGNWLTFFMRLNFIAWLRFIHLVLKEVFIRLGIKSQMQKLIDAYKRINEALDEYLRELEKIDKKQFEIETQKYNKYIPLIENAESEEQLNIVLLDVFDELGIEKPYKGDFDDFMLDDSAVLEFK